MQDFCVVILFILWIAVETTWLEASLCLIVVVAVIPLASLVSLCQVAEVSGRSVLRHEYMNVDLLKPACTNFNNHSAWRNPEEVMNFGAGMIDDSIQEAFLQY